MKRIAAGLLTMVMLLSMMMPVFAEEEKGSITITNTVKDQTYSLYKVFDLESYNGENFSYRVDDNWEPFFREGGAGAQYITLDKDGYIASTSLNNTNAQAFSKAALAWATTNEDVNPCSVTTAAENDQPVIFKNLTLGYYLVDSTLGTMCILETNIKDLTIEDKNKEATLTYEVKTGVNSENIDTFGEVHHTDIISELDYKIVVSAMPGAENYEIYVKKPSGIDATIGSIAVTIQPKTVPNNQDQTSSKLLEEGTHYELLPRVSPSSDEQDFGYDFGIAINQENVLDYIKDAEALITITYKAWMNENVSYSTIKEAKPNTSTAWMTFGTNSATEAKNTSVYTYHLPIFKYTGSLEDPTALAKAHFYLYREVTEETKEYALFTSEGKFAGWTKEESDATILVSGEDGMINLYGLSTGDYYLKETVAPDGYNKLIHPIEITISAGENHIAAYAQDDHETDQINVLNNTGSKLPSTGGMGTKIFYALGATMFVSAVILLVVRKRMSK